MKRLVVTGSVLVSILSCAAHASADEAREAPPSAADPAPPAPNLVPPRVAPTSASAPSMDAANAANDLARFRAFARDADGKALRYSLATGFVELGVGAILLPTGAVIHSRDASAGSGLALGFGIGATVSGVLTLLDAIGRPLHGVEGAIEREKAARHDDTSALAAGEDEFRRSAAGNKLERRIGGGIFVGLGLTALGLGTAFAAADLTTRTFDRGDQDGLASAFLVGGAVATMAGLAAVFVPTETESQWEGYSAGKRPPVTQVRIVGVSASPLPGGGGSAGITGRF